jgi:hypothetical protein
MAARAGTVKAFEDRQAAFRAATPDYGAKLDAATVKISDQMRDAIVESEVGPQILYHLAEHPEVAESMGKLTVGKMLREFGRLEATLGGAAKPPAKSDEPKQEEKPAARAEISQAPAPISPLKGNGASVHVLKATDEVPREMGYEEWKKLYIAGRIKG